MIGYQLDLLTWTPPGKKATPKKRRSEYDEAQLCRCGKNIGRSWVWRDALGVDHIECEACLSPPRMPYWRPRSGPHAGLIGADLADGERKEVAE